MDCLIIMKAKINVQRQVKETQVVTRLIEILNKRVSASGSLGVEVLDPFIEQGGCERLVVSESHGKHSLKKDSKQKEKSRSLEREDRHAVEERKTIDSYSGKIDTSKFLSRLWRHVSGQVKS